MSNNNDDPPNNGAVLNIAQIIQAVMTSACEAEIGAMYINGRKAVPMRNILKELGHPQPRTPMQTDNTAAQAVVTNNVQSKCTKAMDMCFHWLRDRVAQKQFRIFWRHGPNNRGDHWTKHFAAPRHRSIRPEMLTPKCQLDDLRRRQQRAQKVCEIAQALVETAGRSLPATRVC